MVTPVTATPAPMAGLPVRQRKGHRRAAVILQRSELGIDRADGSSDLVVVDSVGNAEAFGAVTNKVVAAGGGEAGVGVAHAGRVRVAGDNRVSGVDRGSRIDSATDTELA